MDVIPVNPLQCQAKYTYSQCDKLVPRVEYWEPLSDFMNKTDPHGSKNIVTSFRRLWE